MKTFRSVIFWMHLVAGAMAGVIIFIMSVTGALLAFERQVIELGERDARIVAARPGETRLSPQQVIDRLKEQRPDVKPSAMTITDHPDVAWLFNLGREGQVYVDPYTGTITGEGNKSVRGAMSELRNWHRYIALSGDQRPIGKAITGAANLLFLFLAMSGIYIWFPRNLVWKAVKPVLWFKRGLRGKARNFNWHNTIGFWTSFLLIVFTVTASVISYQWATNLLYTLTGNEVPGGAVTSSNNPPPQTEKPFEFPTNIDPVWQNANYQAPNAKSVSLRLPIENGGAVFTIDEGIYWNIFARSTLTIDAATAEVKKWDAYGDRNAAVQIRSWFRYTHTGETGGIVGQILGLIACIGGAFLVWTGFSLALRRLQNWWKRRENNDSVAADS